MLTHYFRRTPTRRGATLHLFTFMSEFREAMWASCSRARRISSSTSPATPRSASAAWPKPPKPPSSPTRWRPHVAIERDPPEQRPLRDHRRRRGRRLDRLSPGQVGYEEVVLVERSAGVGLDLPFGGPRRPDPGLSVADEDDDALGRALPRIGDESSSIPGLGRVRGHRARIFRRADGGTSPAGRLRPRRSACRSS